MMTTPWHRQRHALRGRAALLWTILVLSLAATIGVAQRSDAAYPEANGRIVFASLSPSEFDIWSVNPDGSGLLRLTNSPDLVELSPRWSPDGSQIVFTAGGGTNTGDVWVMDHDGSNLHQVTDLPGTWGAVSADWSPGGSQFVIELQYWGASSTDLYVVEADGSGLTQITDLPGSEMGPVWSPDGSRIAFSSFDLGLADVWTVAADGSSLTQVTSLPRVEYEPDWSPDGSRLVFSEYNGFDFVNRLWVVDADGSDPMPITEVDTFDGDAAWSPDGERLVFNSDGELWVMDADGSARVSIGIVGKHSSWQPLIAGCVESCARVSDLTLRAERFGVGGVATIADEAGAVLGRAVVSVEWTLPGGETIDRTSTTNPRGVAHFRVPGGTGTYTLSVTDVSLSGYTFDPANSVVSATVVKDR